MSVATGKGWTMHLGDCLEVMATLEKVDHVITDPPYSRHVHSSARSNGRLALPDVADFACRTRRRVDLGFEHLRPALRRGCAIAFVRLSSRWVMTFSDVESAWMWRMSQVSAGLDYVKTAAWHRLCGAPQFTGDRPASAFEAITLCHPVGRKRWNGGGKQGFYAVATVLNRGGKSPRIHTTQKPVDLMLALAADFSDPGETILDPFAGSGTTGVACLRLGRTFIGIEKDPTYFALACERLRAEEHGSTLQAARAGQVAMFGSKP